MIVARNAHEHTLQDVVWQRQKLRTRRPPWFRRHGRVDGAPRFRLLRRVHNQSRCAANRALPQLGDNSSMPESARSARPLPLVHLCNVQAKVRHKS